MKLLDKVKHYLLKFGGEDTSWLRTHDHKYIIVWLGAKPCAIIFPKEIPHICVWEGLKSDCELISAGFVEIASYGNEYKVICHGQSESIRPYCQEGDESWKSHKFDAELVKMSLVGRNWYLL